jgi:U3 small nucleolar ribonucleoprotein component
MVGRALSITTKRRKEFKNFDQKAHNAAAAYLRSKVAHACGEITKVKSLRAIAEEFGVNYMKASRLTRPGAKTQAESNHKKGHLSDEEEQVLDLVNDIELSSQRGLPRTHKEIEEFVNYLLKQKYVWNEGKTDW